MIAFVRGVTSSATRAGSMLRVPGSTSAKTGVAPRAPARGPGAGRVGPGGGGARPRPGLAVAPAPGAPFDRLGLFDPGDRLQLAGSRHEEANARTGGRPDRPQPLALDRLPER